MARPTSFYKAIAQLYRDYLELLEAYGAFGKLVQEAAEDFALRERLARAPKQILQAGSGTHFSSTRYQSPEPSRA